MNIIVENGSYHMDNMGDVAMLQVCVQRVRRRWPNARVRVLNEAPDRLEATCPGAEALLPARWHAVRVLPKRLLFRGTWRIERSLPFVWPALARLGKRVAARGDAETREGIDRLYQAIREADVVICSGGGFLTDWHAEHADSVLHTLGLAQSFGASTAFFSAGIGPLDDRTVAKLATRVLNRLDLLALRESAGNGAELKSLGVEIDDVVVTGDDAVVLAHGLRVGAVGRGVGINVRMSPAAGVPDEREKEVAEALEDFAAAQGTELVGVPIRDRRSPGNDVDAMVRLFGAHSGAAIGAAAVETPADVIRLVGRCRIVVTGAYHAGVFALAQGIPVVALTGTKYYHRKMAGLAEQFGAGVRLVPYDAPDFTIRLNEAMSAAWDTAPAVRGDLLAAAERQIESSRAAYSSFFDTVERGAWRQGSSRLASLAS